MKSLIFSAIAVLAFWVFITAGLGITVSSWPIAIGAYVVMLVANVLATATVNR